MGPVNVHLIRREPITLVDVGPLLPEAWDALEEGLRAHGLGLGDVQQVLLTHGHHDHYGQAARLAEVSGARLLGGRLDAHHFGRERRGKRLLDDMARADFDILTRFVVVMSVAAIDRYAEPLAAWDELQGGEVLEGDGWSVRVSSTPGHTPGSLTFEIPEAGVLFTGDTVLKGITPNAVVEEDRERPGQLFRSVSRYLETLGRIEEANAGSVLLTGHGEAIADPAAHFRAVERKARNRVRRLLGELAGGPRTVRELVVALFPRVRRINIFLAYSEILGFLMHLEDAGLVEKRPGTLRDRYRLAARCASGPRPEPRPGARSIARRT